MCSVRVVQMPADTCPSHTYFNFWVLVPLSGNIISEKCTFDLPIIRLWGFFRCSKVSNSVVCAPIWSKFELVQDFLHGFVSCRYKKGSDQYQQSRKVETSYYPFITLWELYVAMETRVLNQNIMQPSPIPNHVQLFAS